VSTTMLAVLIPLTGSQDLHPGSRIPLSGIVASLLSFQPRVLLIDQTLIQLLEERRRLAQRLTSRQLTRRLGLY
jgi:hypothetical protein